MRSSTFSARPLRLVLTAGNTSDIKGADLSAGETVGMKRLIADRGHDANRHRATLREQGTIPVIPAGAIASGRSSMTSVATVIAGVSKRCSAASRIPPGRYPLRQARPQLPVTRHARSRHRLWL